MMTTPTSAGADGHFQSPPLWTMPTNLEFDSSAADGLAEQWLTVVGKKKPRHQGEPAPAQQPLAPDRSDAQLVPDSDVVAPSGIDTARAASQASDLDEHSPRPADASAVCINPAEDEAPAPERLRNEGAVSFQGVTPSEQVNDSAALMGFAGTAIGWPVGRSIDTYIHRVEAAQLALVIAQIDSEHVEAQRLRAKRQLRRAMSAFAVGAVASALFVTLAFRIDSSSDAVVPAAAVPAAALHRPAASPIGASVTFRAEVGPPDTSESTIRRPSAPSKARTPSGPRRKRRQL